jgi:hypothetical protein
MAMKYTAVASTEGTTVYTTSFWILLFVFLSLLYFSVTLSVALCLSIYPGVPTISLLLAEQLWFTVSTMVFLITWIVCMTILLGVYAPSPDGSIDDVQSTSSSCCRSFSIFAAFLYYIFIFLAIVHVGLIPVIKLTDYPMGHYIITGMLIVYWQFCQTFLFISRVIVYKESKNSNHGFLLFLNGLVVCIAGICATVFVAISYERFQAEMYMYIGYSEYVLFKCWLVAPIFHCIEIDSARYLKNK